MKRLPLLFLTLACLAAFAWRVHHLDAQSMWSDEGLSLYRARQDVPTILANRITIDDIDTHDTNPPLYFLLLHAWRALAGESVFALRYFGVALGLLAVPLLYELGRRAFNRRTGLLAAGLLAISPFHIWQLQELRNYPLLLTLNILSVYALLRALTVSRNRGKWLALWAGASLLGIYTHYFAFFVFAFGLLALLLWAGQRRWSPPAWVWIGGALLGAALLPVIAVALGRLRAGQQSGFVYVPPQDILSHAASVYSVGFAPTVVQPLWRVAPVLLLVVLGAAGLLIARRRAATLFILAYLFVPLGLLLLLSLITPLYNGQRHLFMGLPPYLLLAAAGVDSLARRWRWAAVALALFVLGSQISWTHTQFTAANLVKDDVRGVADYLNRVAGPDDVVVLHDAILKLTFDYYYHGAAAALALPRYAQMSVADGEAAMQTAGAAARRVWFLAEPLPRDGFPPFALTDWVNAHWAFVTSCRFPAIWLGLNLAAYLPQPAAIVPATATTTDVPVAAWVNGLQLVRQQAESAGRAGDVWWSRLDWRGLAPEGAPLTLSLRLMDDAGNTWAQVDRPLPRELPTQPDEVVRREFGLPLPEGLPPGHYQVWLRLVAQPDNTPVYTDAGPVDVLLQPDFVVTASAFRQSQTCLPAFTARAADMGGGISLLGYRLPQGQYRPGHEFPLQLFWQASRVPRQDYQLRIQLLAADGRIVGETLTTPIRPEFPPTQWQPGQVVQGQANMLIPAAAPDGLNLVRIALVDPQTGRQLSVRPQGALWGQTGLPLDEVQVVAWPYVAEMPPISTPARVDFGAPPQIALHGYDLERTAAQPGDTVNLTLYWRSLADLAQSYVVLVHLSSAEEVIVGQGDGPPDRGVRPTTSWREGEVIVDTHSLTVAADTAPGTYRLWVGLYDRETGERMPAFSATHPASDNRIWLTDLQITEAAP